jgi:hypothetical protein
MLDRPMQYDDVSVHVFIAQSLSRLFKLRCEIEESIAAGRTTPAESRELLAKPMAFWRGDRAGSVAGMWSFVTSCLGLLACRRKRHFARVCGAPPPKITQNGSQPWAVVW